MNVVSRPRRIPMDKLERRWRLACYSTGVTFGLALFIVALCDERTRRNVDAAEIAFMVPFLLFGAALCSFVITLFVVGISSRIAMNLIVRERRRKFQTETVVLVFTFGVLCWMFYSLYAYPGDGL